MQLTSLHTRRVSSGGPKDTLVLRSFEDQVVTPLMERTGKIPLLVHFLFNLKNVHVTQ